MVSDVGNSLCQLVGWETQRATDGVGKHPRR